MVVVFRSASKKYVLAYVFFIVETFLGTKNGERMYVCR